MSDLQGEEARIREAYARRDRAGKRSLYAWHRADVLFTRYRFRAVSAKLFLAHGWDDWSGKDILDVGCGSGAWLRGLLDWGADPARLHGIDLLPDRIDEAKRLAPTIDFRVATAWPIPFPDASMDLVSAHTVFSSILDRRGRERLAREMARVLGPAGKILINDFRISHPRNPDTIGIPYGEIQRLFADFRVHRRTLTLAPPIQKLLANASPLLTHACESLFPFLRTHALYLIGKDGAK